MEKEKYYKLTKNTKTILTEFNKKLTLYQIESVKNFIIEVNDITHRIRVGELGGWVESENNLAQDGSWIFQKSIVRGHAVIMGRSSVLNGSTVRDRLKVYKSVVMGSSDISGNAEITNTTIYDKKEYFLAKREEKKYYKLSGRTKVNDKGVTLFQIETLRDIFTPAYTICHPDCGGWVESEKNLMQDGSWIGPDVEISGNTLVMDSTLIQGKVIVSTTIARNYIDIKHSVINGFGKSIEISTSDSGGSITIRYSNIESLDSGKIFLKSVTDCLKILRETCISMGSGILSIVDSTLDDSLLESKNSEVKEITIKNSKFETCIFRNVNEEFNLFAHLDLEDYSDCI